MRNQVKVGSISSGPHERPLSMSVVSVMTGVAFFSAVLFSAGLRFGGLALADEQPAPLDLTKRRVESSTELLVEASSRTAQDQWTNPRVRPGDVNWHPDAARAEAAAAKSKKPVLLFQMMGRLDEKFC